jgi:hypothetical protein
MSEFELNDDSNEFEVLEGFIYNGGNNNNSISIRYKFL